MAGETSKFVFVCYPDPSGNDSQFDLHIFKLVARKFISWKIENVCTSRNTKVVNPFSADLQGNKAKPPKNNGFQKHTFFSGGSLSAITSVLKMSFRIPLIHFALRFSPVLPYVDTSIS